MFNLSFIVIFNYIFKHEVKHLKYVFSLNIHIIFYHMYTFIKYLKYMQNILTSKNAI